MKINTEIQYAGKAFIYDDVVKKVKEDWVGRGNKVKDLDANLYLNVEESTVYYVVKDETYSVCLMDAE